jgi:hypothetical protein
MADKVREQGQRQREDARQRRRSLAQQPFEELDEATEAEGGSAVDVRALLKRALGTAAAAALAGGVAGGAKALLERRKRSEPATDADEEDSLAEERGDAEEPASRATAQDTEPDEDEPRADHSPEGNPTPAKAEEQMSTEPDDEQPEERDSAGDDDRRRRVGAQGAASSDVEKIVERAKSEVEHLLGTESEGVSGIERSNGSWCVTVEVVEVRRVPDSTDVLASYGVVLDGEGNLVSLERKRRYRRSQVEEV